MNRPTLPRWPRIASYARNLLAAALLVVVLLVAGGAWVALRAEQGPGFARYSLALRNEFADAFVYDLDGDGLSELVVLEAERGLSRDVPHTVRVFRQTGEGFAAQTSARAPLPEHLSLAGMGSFRGGPGLALLIPGGVEIWPWTGERFEREALIRLEVESIFPVPNGGLKTGLPWIHDLDDDGISELLVPRFDGLLVLRQDAAGSLVEHALLPMRPNARLLNYFRRRMVAYDLPSFALVDVDGSGWKDVAMYSNGLLRVYLLDGQQGTIERLPVLERELQPPRPFDPKLPWDPPLLLVTAQDLNDDGLFDLVFSKTAASDSQFNTRTSILIHYGRRGENGAPIDYGEKADQVFLSEGFTLPLLVDINGDRRTDLVMVNVEIGFWSVIKALITRSIDAEAAFYLMRPDGRYPAQPDDLESYGVNFSLGRFNHQPIATFGDLNGDKLPDLVLSVDRERIGIHWGREGEIWDSDYDAEWEDFIPIHGKRVRVEDLNSDGREDLLFFYNRDDIRQMPQVNKTITVLRSRFDPSTSLAHRRSGPSPSATR